MKDLAYSLELEAELSTSPQSPLSGASMRPHMKVSSDWMRPKDHREWNIWWDDFSSFGQIFPRPSASEVMDFYEIDNYYTHSERSERDTEAENRAVGFIGHVLRSVAYRFEHGAEPTKEWWRSVIPADAKRGLEIGCGDGDRMLTYGGYLQSVTGVEPDVRAVDIARERGLDVHEGTAETLPPELDGNLYDFIVFTHVLEHTIDPVLSLENAAKMLSDTGIMSIEVPNNGSIGARRMGSAWRWLDVPRLLNFFTDKSLQACAKAAGLKVEAQLYRGYVRQFTPDWIMDEAKIRASQEGRKVNNADVSRQLWHSVRLLASTAMAHPSKKYDSIRILCSRA